jgi:hypothetical protein
MNKQLAGVVLSVALGFTGGVAGCATSPRRSVVRGAVLARSPGARMIVAGPVTMHAYAGFAGGDIYETRATTGTDADCEASQHVDAVVSLPADRVVSVTVLPGAVACLRIRDGGGYEPLWHAIEPQPATELIAAATVQVSIATDPRAR